MRSATLYWGAFATVVAAGLIVAVPDWTWPTGQIRQIGNSPASMLQFDYGQAREPVQQTAPPALPAAADGPPATQVYHNVQVLTDVSAPEFMRLQTAITQWVSPVQGCDFCHVGQDYASDAKPTKAAARLMLQMTRHLNADWASHVAPAGVTCFTCHRGQPVPAETWFPSSAAPVKPFVATQEPYQESADTVRNFFPDAGWAEYFLEDTPITGAQSQTVLPHQQVAAPVVVKRIYEMMMQMADGIGVNCGYCHNSRAFFDWRQSTPERWVAYGAIRLLRDLNQNFMLKLSTLVPQSRMLVNPTGMPVLPERDVGPQRGNGLLVCATCHDSRPEPLGGAHMLADYPGLSPAKAASAATGPEPGAAVSAPAPAEKPNVNLIPPT